MELLESFEEFSLLESVKSQFMSKFLSKQIKGATSRGYKSTFLSQFQKSFNLALDKMGDEYFNEVPAQAVTPAMIKDESNVIFWIYTHGAPESKYHHGDWLLGVSRGKNTFYAKSSGVMSRDSSDGRSYTRRGGTARADSVGMDKYQRETFGFNNRHNTRQYKEAATYAVIFDYGKAIAAHSVRDLKNSRAESREGATALMTNKDIKKMNQARYEQLKRDRLDPDSIFPLYQEVLRIASDKLGEYMKFVSLKDFNKIYDFQSRFAGWSHQEFSQTIQQVLREIRDYAYTMKEIMSYVEHYKEEGREYDITKSYHYGKLSNHATTAKKMKKDLQAISFAA